MEQTVDAIVDASSHPLSIVIVGVGPAGMCALQCPSHPQNQILLRLLVNPGRANLAGHERARHTYLSRGRKLQGAIFVPQHDISTHSSGTLMFIFRQTLPKCVGLMVMTRLSLLLRPERRRSVTLYNSSASETYVRFMIPELAWLSGLVVRNIEILCPFFPFGLVAVLKTKTCKPSLVFKASF